MRILLLGKDGQVGWELQRALAPLGDRQHSIAATPRRSLATCRNRFVWSRPCVSFGRTSSSMRLPTRWSTRRRASPTWARAVNATAPGALAREAAACGAWLVHYSTDYVFDGTGLAPWAEDDPTGPLNVYGRTKLEGEQLIRASGCRHLILRTSWVYASRGSNFARTMLRLAAERESLTVINDQHGAPTGADLLADVTAHALLAIIRRPELAGTYHVAASGETTWHGYAEYVVEWARAAGQPITVQPDAIRAVPSTAFVTAAKRPANSRLATSKLRHAFNLILPDWQTGVRRMLTEVLGR